MLNLVRETNMTSKMQETTASDFACRFCDEMDRNEHNRDFNRHRAE